MSTYWSLVGTPNCMVLSPLVRFFLFRCNSGIDFVYDFIQGGSLMFTLGFMFSQYIPYMMGSVSLDEKR